MEAAPSSSSTSTSTSSGGSVTFYDFLDRMRNPASLDLVRSIKRYLILYFIFLIPFFHFWILCFYSYIYCCFPPPASLYRFHSTRPTLTMMGKRCKTSTCQWKQPLWNTHCGQLLLLKNLTLQWRYSLLCNCNRALITLFLKLLLNTLYVCFSFSFSFSFTQG